jgi:hypothetical protein
MLGDIATKQWLNGRKMAKSFNRMKKPDVPKTTTCSGDGVRLLIER